MPRPFFPLIAFTGLLSLSACVSLPSGLNLSLERPTAQHKYRVAVHPLAEPISINKIHAWEIQLRTPSGEAVSGARIDVGGGMPQHGHGMEAAFKTPSLRNVALRAPYMHAGQMPSLDVVVSHYARAPVAAAGQSELTPFALSEQDVRDLVAFLGTLNEEPGRSD